jgi:UDP-N-acetylglucosamine 1-carboxyvinyltransferase
LKYLKITGNQKLTGTIDIQPAKNSILLVIVASLLTNEEVIIEDYVDIIDLKHMLELLEELHVEYAVSNSSNTGKTQIVMKKHDSNITRKDMIDCIFQKNLSVTDKNYNSGIYPNLVYDYDKFRSKDDKKIAFISNEIYQFFGDDMEVHDVQIQDKIATPVNTENYSDTDTPEDNVYILSDIAEKVRTSILFWGAMLANGHSVVIKLPGGCNLGTRAYDMHIDALTQMGACIEEKSICDEDYIFAKLDTPDGKLRGIEYTFRQISVTGTANILMAATLAKGDTILHNIAIEPEILNLIELLRKMSADISFLKSRSILIKGNDKLNGARHEILKDRIEAGTYLIAGAGLGNKLRVNISPTLVESTLNVLSNMGAIVEKYPDHVVISNSRLHSIDVFTGPYPEFSTDLQPQLTSLLSIVEGKSRIFETMFDSRICHVDELQKMGANIKVDGRVIIVNGVLKLSGSDLKSYALRGAAAMVLAAMFAQGESCIFGVEKLYRGYDNIVEKLANCGAIIEEHED